MARNSIQIIGDKEFNNIVKLLPDKLQPRVVRDIARKAGRVIVKAARRMVKIPGTLGKQFASEMVVVNDKRDKSAVNVTVRGGRRSREFVSSSGQKRISAAAGRHMTEGTIQKERVTKSGQRRGKVSNRYPDPIEEAGQTKANDALREMEKHTVSIIEKHIKRYAKKL